MTARTGLPWVGVLFALVLVTDGRAAEAPAARTVAARDALAPAAPVLPGAVVASLQEGRFAEAVTALNGLAEKAKDADERDYYALIRGVALRLSGQGDQARQTLADALNAHPKGRWAGKLRSELAAVALAAGRFAEAEALARAEAEHLLDGTRKDRLAEVYHTFARALLKPDDPVTPADPNGAYALLVQARELAKGEVLRAHLLFDMGRASQTAHDHNRAIGDFQNYRREYPRGADRFEARFRLGAAQMQAGQPLPARLTWTDLARDLAAAGRPLSKDEDDLRAKALYEIARTYGIPNPPDDTSLNLGVAALRRYLTAYPAHPWAVKASYEIAAAYLARGKSQEGLEALNAFLKEDGFQAEDEEAKRDLARLSMTATFQVAGVLQGQEKFAEAIAAWKGYLAKFPNGPQSADAQRMILDTQLLIADEHLRRERYAEARAAWQAFVAQNPLDGRVPQVLFQIGASWTLEKKFDQAIAAWEPLLSKFPQSEPAAHAQFAIAALFETEKGKPAEAIERFRKVAVEPWRSQALQRVAVMESKALTVVTPRTFRSGEKAHLTITTRNLEKLTFTAYKLNVEAYFRKKHALAGVEALDISLVRPDAEWTVEVPGYARYKPIEQDFHLKVDVPGAYVVKVTDEKTLQATTLVLGSDLDAIVKTSKDHILVFAQDMKTGLGRAGARVLVADGGTVVLDAKTGKDGVLLTAWEKPFAPGAALQYLVLDGENVAGSGLGLPGTVAQGLSPRAYIYTDRPAYRPGQKVALRGVVREVKDGQYANTPRAVYRLTVTDSRGRQIVARAVTLSEFGTFHESLPLDEAAPVGVYHVRVFQPGKSDFAGQFEVQSYQLAKIDLSFGLKKTVYYRGETVQAELIAKYQYGAPVAHRPVAVQLPDGRILHGMTDAEGKYAVEFPTEGFAEEQALRLVAQLPQDNVATAARVLLAVRAFAIDLHTTREVYLDGESFRLAVSTRDAQGEPIGTDLSVSVLKQVNQAGRVTEREVKRVALKTDPKTGDGALALQVDDDQGGSYVVRVAGTDRFGNPVVADRALLISGKKDETKLRLLADRQSYKVGEEATVNLHARGQGGTALLAWEADRILSYKIVKLQEGDNAVAWAVDGAQFPNFTLTAARMAGARFDEARLDVRVERDLRVAITPARPQVGPGEEVEVEVTTVDQRGRPVAAEVSLALVDKALLRLYGDRLPPIGPFFYNQTRTGAFATEATNTFRYQPATTPVSEAVVEEAERTVAQLVNAADRNRVLEQAKSQVVANGPVQFGVAAETPPPAAEPMSASAAMGRMMAGGMGGGGGAAAGKPAAARFADSFAVEGRGNKDGIALGLQDEALGEMDDKEALEAKGEVALRRQAGALAFRGADARKKANIAAQPRQRFVETAYWNPAVVTGKDGKARVTLPAPMALSSYRFTARGVTGNDTLVGQTTADLTVKKDFFVELKTPAALSQGDRPRFVGEVHHVGLTGKVEVRLAVYAGGREAVYPRTIDVKNDGIEEILFDPFEVPDGENVRLTLTATAVNSKDELVSEVPIRPWGVQAFASASGTSGDGATVFVGLPPGRAYESPEMLVVVAPTLRRLIVELALGRDAHPLPLRYASCIFPPPPDGMAERASDLLAATAALGYLNTTRASAAPEAQRLTERIQGLVSELTAAQDPDGGWTWIGHGPSDRATTARVLWALASAEPFGLLTDAPALDKAATFLIQEFARIGGGDHETRAEVLHALSTRRKATFEQANTLNRARQGLSDASLAYLALTLANLDRVPLANEVLDVLAARVKSEPTQPGHPARNYWQGNSPLPHHRGAVEATALATLAFTRARPQADVIARASEALAHRHGNGWQPPKAKGPAVAALAAYYARAQTAEDRYDLVVTVNDVEVLKTQVRGNPEGHAVLVPRKALKAGAANRVQFAIDGRGTFGYAVTLTGFTRDFGPDQARVNRTALIDRRVYEPAAPELDGKVLPTGFGVAVNPVVFGNQATQVALGGKASVHLNVNRYENRPNAERDFLIVEEHLPAGATLIEGSVHSQANSFTLADGVLTFYFDPQRWPGDIRYDVYGYLPGQYRALPASVRSAYEPGKFHLGTPGELKVLAPGEPNTDPYKPTPDELYARGKADFDAGRLADASAPLEALFTAYTLRDDVAKDAARMLLLINIKANDARKIVQYFEVIKEKAPELVITFDQLQAIGRAYRDINEFERAYLVWRGVAEASYLEDARVGAVLRQRGKTLEGLAYLLDLWREYPNTPSITSDFFGLTQILALNASRAITDPTLRHELAAAGVTRSELLLQAVRTIQTFLAQSPRDPLADEASLALVGAFLELEDYPNVVKLAARFATLYPKSTFLDSFQYTEALGEFHLGHYDRAVAVAETIARATYKDANGIEQPSANKWQALYILGQIYDARRLPDKALTYYRQVAERFSDAAGAIKFFTRNDLKLPEVSVVRPKVKPAVAAGGGGLGLRNVAPDDAAAPRAESGVKIDYRNIAEADVKVYPVDLMRLYLTRRNLDQIAGIDLAGITPLFETTIKLGKGEDYADKVKELDLPLKQEGAYLVMVRGDSLYASGIVLVTPLELEVLEEPESGRVRVTVRDAQSQDLAPKVQVKVIGSDNPTFLSGETDLRGVFVAEGVRGAVTAVARRGTAQYAFYRGKTYIGAPQAPPVPQASAPQAPNQQPAAAPANDAAQALDANVKNLNCENQVRQIERLEKRFNTNEKGGAAAKDFK